MKYISSLIVTIIAATVGFLGVYWWQAYPQVVLLGKNQAQLNALQARAQTSVPDKDDQDKEKTKDATLLLLPDIDNQYDLSVQLDSLSKKVGVKLTALGLSVGAAASTPAPGQAVGSVLTMPGIQKVSISLSANGSYAQIQQLVAGITSIDRFITIEQLAVSTNTAGSTGSGTVAPTTTDQVVVQINASAYFAPSLTKQ